MPLGRPRAPGTEAERVEVRRAKVRKNVQAFRQRQREKKLMQAASNAAHGEDGGSGRVGGVICREGFLDVSSTSTDVTGLSARSSPGLAGIEGCLQDVPEQDYADPDSWLWRLPQDLAGNAPYQDIFTSAIQTADLWRSDEQEDGRQDWTMSYGPLRSLAGCGSTWFHVVMMETADPGLQIMNDACLASALTVIGRERQDSHISASAAYVQTRALRHLRQLLQRWSEKSDLLCPISLAMAVLTCAMSELIASKSWTDFASHLSGVGSLISYHDPASLSTDAARELFYGYRSLEAAFAFAHGQNLFLAEPRWINLPWKDEVAMSRHPLHKMLDIALRMLPEFESSQPEHKPQQQQPRLESAKALGQTPSPLRGPWHGHVPDHHHRRERHGGLERQQTPHEQEIQEASDRLHRLRCIASELDEWEVEFRNQHAHLGGLHHKKEAEWPGLYDFAFEFTSLPSATAYAMYTGIRVRLAEMIHAALLIISTQSTNTNGGQVESRGAVPPSLSTALASARSTTDAINLLMTSEIPSPLQTVTILPSSSSSASSPPPLAPVESHVAKTEALLQGLRWARQALQSLEYFHTGVMKDCGWVATMFAFDAAWGFVSRDSGGRELEFNGSIRLAREREWCRETAERFEAMGVPLFRRL